MALFGQIKDLIQIVLGQCFARGGAEGI